MNSVIKIYVSLFLLTASLLGSTQSIVITDQIGTIFELDVTTCQATLLASIEDEITDISYLPDGRLIGINGRGEVFFIDLENQETVPFFVFGLVTGNFFNSLTTNASGIIFGMGTDGVLWSYDPEIERFREYGRIPFIATGDLTFYDGSLYVAAGIDKIVEINLQNPSASNIVIESDNVLAIFGIVTETKDCDNPTSYAISSDGVSSTIFQIDFETQTLTERCDIGFEVYGGASLDEFKASNPITINSLDIIMPTCTNPLGSMRVFNSGGFGNIEYSIDGTNFQIFPRFSNLGAGDYTVFIRDETGCTVSEDFTILDVDELSLALLEIGDANCGGRFGRLDVALTGSGSMSGSGSGISGCTFLIFDDVEYDNNFSLELDTGTYNITLANILGERRDTTITISKDNCNVYIPNAIYTESTSQNNQFEVFAEDGKAFTIVNYDIYDEWGNLVYEQDNFSNSESSFWWRGECLQSQCESDVFSYLIDLNFDQGEVMHFTGTVMLFK